MPKSHLANFGPPVSPSKRKAKKRIDFARKPVLQFTVLYAVVPQCYDLSCEQV